MNNLSQNILPFYLVCDESWSMEDYMDTLNRALSDIHQEVGINPVVCDKTRFGIIGFSGTAEVLQPLANFEDLAALPVLSPKNGTSYASAFRLLKHEIENDLDQLKSQGARVFRPTVFFLSDGQPTDDEDKDWLQALEDLTGDGFKYRPNLLAFGIGQADRKTIAKVGKTRAFRVDPSMSPVAALKEFASALTKSIILSGSGPAKQEPQVVIPEVQGFERLDTQEM